MDGELRLRALDRGRDRPLLERLWDVALGPVWPLLPGGLDLVRDGIVAEGRGGGRVGRAGGGPGGAGPGCG